MFAWLLFGVTNTSSYLYAQYNTACRSRLYLIYIYKGTWTARQDTIDIRPHTQAGAACPRTYQKKHYTYATSPTSSCINALAALCVTHRTMHDSQRPGMRPNPVQRQRLVLFRRTARTQDEQRRTLSPRQPDLCTHETAVWHHAEGAQPDERQDGGGEGNRPRPILQTLCAGPLTGSGQTAGHPRQGLRARGNIVLHPGQGALPAGRTRRTHSRTGPAATHIGRIPRTAVATGRQPGIRGPRVCRR